MSQPALTPRPAPRRVLEDTSGRRLRGMRLVGRIVALLALCWLALVILGGLGVGPARHIPFGTALRASPGPPLLRHLPAPRQPTAADLTPAVPAPVLPSAAAAAAAHAKANAKARGHSSVVPGQSTAPGNSGSAPGHTSTTPGNSGSAPGHTVTTTKGKSGTAPGQVRRATTTTTTTTATTTTTPLHGRGLGKLKH